MKEALENKLSLLERETAQIFESIELWPNDSLHDTANGWSVIQVLVHLQVAESASLSYMKKKLLAGEEMGKVKPVYRFKMSLTKIALSSSLKWRAPKQVAHPDGGVTIEEAKENWEKLRASLKAYVDEYPVQWLDRAVYRHPMAGRQGLEAAIDSFIYHQRHHIHQIKRVKRKLAI